MVNECSSILTGGALATSGAETTVSDDRVGASYVGSRGPKVTSEFTDTAYKTSSANSEAGYCSGSTSVERFDYILFNHCIIFKLFKKLKGPIKCLIYAKFRIKLRI